MPAGSTSLVDLGAVALSHQHQVENVRNQLGITHGYFDAWIYGFLENKKFNIDDTLEKLERRFTMEISVLSQFQLTDYMRKTLREGITQDIGVDKKGRVVLYLCADRNHRAKEHNEEDQNLFDIFVSYCTRLRHESKCSQMVMLINQGSASFMKTLDVGLQGDQALRISKFYPGMVQKMYVCGMSSSAAFMARPICNRLPAVVSERLQIVSDSEVKKGALLEYFDQSVLPCALGGTNTCDTPESWGEYANRVENYYIKLKDAVTNKKLTVKEYELGEIGIYPSGKEAGSESASGLLSSSIAHHPQSTATPTSSFRNSFDSLPSALHPRPLLSCRSDYGDDIVLRNDGQLTEQSICDSRINEKWDNIFVGFPLPLGYFFVEEFLRWIESIMEQEEVERYMIMRQMADEVGALLNSEQQGWSIGVKNLDGKAKIHIVGFVKFWTVVLTFLSSIYFFLAVLFWAALAGNFIVALFLGFFVDPKNIFPLSFGITVIFSQGTSICKRGLDIVTAIWSERVIPPLGRLGPKYGVIAEAFLIFLITLTQIVSFIYFCSYGAAVGLQYAIGTAWVIAVCVILLCHAFFFTGFLNHVVKNPVSSSVLRLPFFVFTNREKMPKKVVLPNTIMIVCGLMLMCSLLLGTSFLISGITSLFVCTTVVTIASAWLINVCCDEVLGSVSSIVMSMVTEMMCLSWLYVTFLFGFEERTSGWYYAPIFNVVISGAFFFAGVLALLFKENNLFLRLILMCLFAYFIICWIFLFPFIGWKLGTVIFVFMFHSILNLLLAPSFFSDSVSSFLVGLSTVLLLVACALLGWYGSSPSYLSGNSPSGIFQNFSIPLSSAATQLSAASTRASTTLSSLEAFHQYPVCFVHIESSESSSYLSVADMSYLVEMSSLVKRYPGYIDSALKDKFSNTDLTYEGVAATLENDNLFVMNFTSSIANTTFYVVKQFSPTVSILFMTTWLSSLSMRPFQIFLPTSWLKTFNQISSVVVKLISFPSWDIIDSLNTFVSAATKNSSRNIILLGDGLVGGAVGAAACNAEVTVQAFIFNTPGQLDLSNPLSVDRRKYHERVLPIFAERSVNSLFGVYDLSVAQKLLCFHRAETCSSQTFITESLQNVCSGVDPFDM